MYVYEESALYKSHVEIDIKGERGRGRRWMEEEEE